MEKMTVTRFSDPMMGLAWECEPALRRVRERFGETVEIEERMVVLVRDVAGFMTPEERALPENERIRAHNARLAQIYLDEGPIAGMPIRMEGFRLFGPGRRSSKPLCLAFEAARLACPEKADDFLYRLRRATVAETRVTTDEDVLAQIAAESGMDVDAFRAALSDGRAEAALASDMRHAAAAGVRSLPAFLVSCSTRMLMLQGLPVNGELEEAVSWLLQYVTNRVSGTS